MAFFTIVLIILGIQVSAVSPAQPPPQPKSKPSSAEQPQQGPDTKSPPSPKPGLPAIRGQGEGEANQGSRTKENAPPQSKTPIIREQHDSRQQRDAARKAPSPPSPLARPYKASELQGREIIAVDGEKLGKIEDLIIGRDGRAEFVLLLHGGFLGIGGRLIALPYSTLRQSPEEDSLVVYIEKEKIKRAPAFREGQWPDFYSDAWTRQVRSYYGE